MVKKTEQVLDLTCLDTVAACSEGAEIELRNPLTNQGLGIFVTVLGKDSDTVREYNRVKMDEYLRKAALTRKRGKDAEIQTMERLEEDAIELLTVCTISWRWGDKQGVFPLAKKGKAIEELAFNVPNVKRLYTEMPEARKQIDEAIADLSNFMKS